MGTSDEPAIKLPLPDEKRLALLCVASAEAQYEAGRTINGVDIVIVGKSGGQSKNMDQKHPHQQQRYRGVSCEKRKGVWRARLYSKGEHTTLGRFPTAELAARSHDQAAVFVLGDRAKTNFGVASARAELAQISADDARHARRPFRRLVELREAVRRDQQESRLLPDEWQARAMRQAAATAALSGPALAHIWNHWARIHGQVGPAAVGTHERSSGGDGGSEGVSLPPAEFGDADRQRTPVSVDAWMALVLAAARSAQTVPAGQLAR